MPLFGALAPCGLLEFGSGETDATNIYNALTSSLSGAFDVSQGTHVEATCYARALALATARAQMRHGRDQKHPTLTVEMLPALERRYGLVPIHGQSDESRRSAVAARKLLSNGNRRESLESALRALCGTDFVGLRVVKPGEGVQWPSSPATVGAFEGPERVARTFKLVAELSRPASNPQTFSYAFFGADDGSRILAGEKYCLGLENPGLAESVTILSANPVAMTARANMLYAKDAGASICSYAPMVAGNQRALLIVLKSRSARDVNVRRNVDDLMSRMARAVTHWGICEETTALHAGPWVLGTSILGVTPLGVAATSL